jgi:endonuclease/exonuclease/phosphatase (EEP) superfamily protein YafD
MEKISWTDRVKNEVLHTVKENRSILHNRIDQIWHKNYFLKRVIEGNIRRTCKSDGNTRKKT